MVRFIARNCVGGLRIRHEGLRQFGVVLHLGDLVRLELHDVEIPGPVGLERHGGLVDIAILDPVELGPPLPVVVIGGKCPLLTFVDAGDRERSVADVVLGSSSTSCRGLSLRSPS